ncbi:MAG: rhomboid family intramembrane serine protease [Dehalococcoidales bacterium]
MPLDDRDYMRRSSRSSRGNRGTGGYEWFTQNPVLVLIAVNIVFFLATSIQSNLLNLLGLAPSLFLERPWTIITSMFVHANFLHIFGNMLTLFFFGQALKQLVGPNRFLAVYFIGGIIGNIAFILLKISSHSVVIGASGAIYAVAGALVVLVPTMRVLMWFIAPMPLWIVVLLFFILWSFVPGVAWQAHMGGLAAGLVAGYIFRRSGRYYYLR